MGIVIELQREALDENISIESLMRKAYLVAKKLGLKEFEKLFLKCRSVLQFLHYKISIIRVEEP